ncbi:MAG: DUF4340 domain-containing protein [Anaerolineae bacterium]|nr:DUF4340 domain-containing protein [Anaerolineae bacterium]NUQ06595.1 DUF4340 domain-containing protein [Anaerolineae bacterium]
MRLNRGTIILIIALVLVFAGALLVSNQQTAVPTTPTATPNAQAGPLFAALESATVARYELRQAESSTFIEFARLDAQNWSLNASSEEAGRVADSTLIENVIGQIAGIEYTASFESDQLADFGLDTPQYTIFIETGTGEGYTLYIGNKTPTNPRYYVVMAEGVAAPAPEATAEATSEAAAEATAEAADAAALDPFANLLEQVIETRPAIFSLSGTQTVYIIPQTAINTLTGWLAAPPYAAPTPTPLPTMTPLPEVTAEATAETTAEAAPEATQEATAEATPEATVES